MRRNGTKHWNNKHIQSRNNLILVQTVNAGRRPRCPRDCGVHRAKVTTATASQLTGTQLRFGEPRCISSHVIGLKLVQIIQQLISITGASKHLRSLASSSTQNTLVSSSFWGSGDGARLSDFHRRGWKPAAEEETRPTSLYHLAASD